MTLILVRLGARAEVQSPAWTRWRAGPASSLPDEEPGLLGHARFEVELVRNRLSGLGRWAVAWDPGERAFRSDEADMVEGNAGFVRMR